jgi:hypothetical protein
LCFYLAYSASRNASPGRFSRDFRSRITPKSTSQSKDKEDPRYATGLVESLQESLKPKLDRDLLLDLNGLAMYVSGCQKENKNHAGYHSQSHEPDLLLVAGREPADSSNALIYYRVKETGERREAP